eukprot:scpid74107/ scgid9973/ 
MAALRWALVLMAVASVVCSQPDKNARQLKDLETALSMWRKISAGSNGYIVHNQLIKNKESDLHYVDMTSGMVKHICAKPTVAPTKPTALSFRRKLIKKVQDMFSLLKKILHDNLCKVVHIVYSKNNAYPVIAKLAGCKDPAMDGIVELGSVLLTPKKHTSKQSLCSFASKHSKVMTEEAKVALDFANSYLSVGTIRSNGFAHVADEKTPIKIMRTEVAVTKPVVVKKEDGQRSDNLPQDHRPYIINEAGYGNSLHLKHKGNGDDTAAAGSTGSDVRTIADIRRVVSGHAVHDTVMSVDGKKLEKIIDGTKVYIAYAGRVIFEGVTSIRGGPVQDLLTSMLRNGHLLITYNNKVIYEARHGGYDRYHRIRKGLFYSGGALLGLAIVMVLGKSVAQTCRARKVVRKVDDSVNYAALVEDELVIENCPEYKPQSAHYVTSPELV